MTRTERHLRHHLETSVDTANGHGVTIENGIKTCRLTCVHPGDYTNTVYIWFDSVSAEDLMVRFGIRRISQLKLITPEQMQIVFEQQWGQLFVNAEKGAKLMECRWKNGQLWRYEANQPLEKVKYDQKNVFTLITHAMEYVTAIVDGE